MRGARIANAARATHNRGRFSLMPTYEYACQKCGHQFEQFQSMRDDPLKTCPKCKKAGLKRLVGGGAGLIFKGSGFYITDYKNKAAPKSESGGGGGESKSSESKSSESKSSDTKSSSDSKSSGSSSSSSSSSSSGTKKK
jgi:putative FmdB family regulatory protein